MIDSLATTLACSFNSQHAMLELLSKLHMAVTKQNQHRALELINEQLGVELKQQNALHQHGLAVQMPSNPGNASAKVCGEYAASISLLQVVVLK